MIFDFGLVKKQTKNFSEINKILEKSYRSIRTAENAFLDKDFDGSLTMAYESMLKTTIALMLSDGFRPRIQLGHHKTLVSYAKHKLTDSLLIVENYERIRKKRNKTVYDVESVTRLEAEKSVSIANKYFTIVEKKISKDNPQQKLRKP